MLITINHLVRTKLPSIMDVQCLSTTAGEAAPFRRLLPAHGHPKLASLSSSTAQEWYMEKRHLPALQDFLRRLEARNIERPFRGITSDGKVDDGLFQYASDEGAPAVAMMQSASNLIGLLSPKQKEDTVFSSVEADEIRIWSNPEFYVNPGRRLKATYRKEINR